MEKNGRKIKNFIIACLLCTLPVLSGVAINNNFLMDDNQIRCCTINEVSDFHLVKTQLQEKQELNPCQRHQSQEFSSIDTYDSLDYLNISEGLGIQYHVTDTYGGLDCSVWSIVQCYNRSKGNRDFVITLIRSHDDEEYYCNSTLGGRVSYNINGRNLTFFQSGCPCGNQANFYMMFSLPRWFQDGDFWTFNDQEFNVQFIGTQIVNNIEFHDCIQINIDNTADDSKYLNGIGYFIVAKDVGIVKLVFNRTLGKDVCYEYVSHQNMEAHSIAGTILDTYGLPAQGISVQISNCDSCIRSIADGSGKFEIETYGFDMILRIGYDLDDGVIMDFYPDFPFEYPVTNITSDVSGLLIIVPSVQLINTVYVDDDYDENTPGWGYDHFDNIQDGIDAVVEGGTVYVFNGTYYENVVVDKTINLIGEDRDGTIIDGNSNINNVMKIEGNNVNISTFTIKNSRGFPNACIKIHSSYNTIYNCDISNINGDYGIRLENLSNACNNVIYNCHIYSHKLDGIFLGSTCNNNTIYNCIIHSNIYDGIHMYRSVDNMIYNSEIFNNADDGINIHRSKNTIYGCFIHSNNDRGILLYRSNNNTIYNCNILNNIGEGIIIHESNYNIINNCNISNNQYGLFIWQSSTNNTIYHSRLIENTPQAYDECSNIWDDGYPSGGNYWSDFDEPSEGVYDNNGDGIADIPYNIPGGSNQDLFPLMYPWGENRPVALFSYTVDDFTVTFDASSSYDRDGTILSYVWDFENDGNYDTTWLSTPTITHVYNTSGNYTVTLQVLDNSNATDMDTAIVSISCISEKPIANAGGPYYGLTGHEIFVNATASYGVDGEITGYRWDFDNDGNYDTTWLSTPATTFIYTKPGTYIIKLEVKDNGEATDTDTAIANIYQSGNCPPVPILGDVYYGLVNKSISFDASRSFDLDGKIIGYRWDFNNDGHWNTTWLTSPFETHVYFSEGVYFAKLMVMDNDGLTNTTTTLVKVSEPINTPPSKPELPYPWNCSKGVCLNPTLSWQSSTDPDDDPISYDVYFGASPNPSKASDGQVSTLFTPNSLMNNTKYYWYIVAKDNHDNEVKSDLWEFTTENKLSEIMVGEITGGANGVNVELWNIGETYTSNIEWSMKFEPIDGGEILQPSNHFVWGMIRRPPTNHCTNISSGQLQGYGYFGITIIADDQTKTALGFVVLGYVSIIDNEI